MQQFTLELFRKHDTGYDLRILQQQTLLTTHWVEQSDIDALLATTAQHYTLTASDLQQRGQALFNWIDQHSHGWLREVRTHHPSLALTIDVREAGLGHLPWELLHDGDHYLCAHPLHLFTPLRRVTPAERQHSWQPEKRQLGVLFMASAPEDLSPKLDFEAEEAGILHATAQKPLDLQVEESGSLSGLEQRLDQYEQSPDVIHLSGHAGIDEQQQPQFFLEDDIGNTAPASPLAFACCLRDGNAQPKLVFLSGCRTGESTLQENVLSFSEQLVDAGVPVVLGWALPVGDQAASQAAAILYEKLAKGFGISEAVAQCRQQLLENNSPYWHLLRCYVDGSPLQPLVKKGHLRIRPHNTSQEFLDAASGKRLPVCSRTEFIGRRRLLQRCLKSLRAYSGCEGYAEGVLLYGMGGLGKSSAAARIIDRLRNHYQPIIIYGGLDETVLLSALDNALSSPEQSVQALLNHPSLDLEGRLQALFQAENNPYSQKPLLLVLDDFEQNIPKQQRGNAQANYQPDALRVLNAIVQAIHRSQSDSRLMITSRYDVPVSAPCCLHKENPLTLHGSDLDKKLAQLPNLQISATANDDTDEHRENHLLRLRAIEIAAGNPRLLEWLDTVLADGQDRLSIPALFRKLENKQAEFREAVLIADLVSAQEKKVQKTLACASLYQVPVTLDAITALRNTPDAAQHLQAAAQVGLIEITKHGGNTTYFVSNLLDAVLEDQLDLATTKTLAAKAAQHLYNALENQASETWRLEIVRLARLGMQQAIAVEVGNALAFSMYDNDRYREAEALCHQLLSLGEISTTLRLLSQAEFRLGNGEQGVEHIERAVALLPANKDSLNDEKLKESALTLGALADILQARGQLDDALRIRKNEELPVYEKLGDVRSKAVTMGQIADILQARGQLDDALRILQDEVLTAFEKLGDVRSKAVTMGKIADILQARGQLDDALRIRKNEELPVYEKLGDVRSKAVTMGKIADILQARGQLDDALRILQDEVLTAFEKLGDVRSKAVTMGKIADILQARGQLDDALRIRQNEQLPVYEKLGDVRSLLVGRTNIAITLWQIDQQQHADEIQTLLCLAFNDAKRLQIPEAETIENLMAQMGLSCSC